MFPIRDTVPSRHLPVAMAGLIVANVLVFFLELQLPDGALEGFFQRYGVVPNLITHPAGESSMVYTTLLTSMFLHGGWLHLISNMWMFWIFGDNVEDRMGVIRFCGFYLLCGLISALVHVLTNVNSEIPTVGASGAIAGVMGAYFVLYPQARILTLIPIFFWPLFVEIPAVIFLGIWLLTQVFSGTAELVDPQAVGGIAWWAHIGGFVAGMFLCRVFVQPAKSHPWPEKRSPRVIVLNDDDYRVR